jgi:hypothetical protein
MRFGDIDLADARARIFEAAENGGYIYPPLETDTWPASRPLAEWLLRLLPSGGTGYVRPEWSQAAPRKLANWFFRSPFGQRLDNKDNRDLRGRLRLPQPQDVRGCRQGRWARYRPRRRRGRARCRRSRTCGQFCLALRHLDDRELVLT